MTAAAHRHIDGLIDCRLVASLPIDDPLHPYRSEAIEVYCHPSYTPARFVVVHGTTVAVGDQAGHWIGQVLEHIETRSIRRALKAAAARSSW